MRKVIWSPKAVKDYSIIIEYLLTVWTIKEVQRFIDKVMSVLTTLENGDIEFRKIGIKDYHIIVIQKHTSIIYRKVSHDDVQIVRIWDNRRNPQNLI